MDLASSVDKKRFNMTGWRAPPSLMADSPVPKVNDANRVEGEEGNRGAGVLSYDMLARKALEKAGRAGKLFSELHKKSSTRKGNDLAASRLKRDSDGTGNDSLETTGTGQAFQEKENISLLIRVINLYQLDKKIKRLDEKYANGLSGPLKYLSFH